MKVQVLGTGCAKCRKLTENARAAVAELGLDAEVVKVTEINEIIAMGAVMMPALAVDGEVRSAGRALSVEALKEILT